MICFFILNEKLTIALFIQVHISPVFVVDHRGSTAAGRFSATNTFLASAPDGNAVPFVLLE